MTPEVGESLLLILRPNGAKVPSSLQAGDARGKKQAPFLRLPTSQCAQNHLHDNAIESLNRVIRKTTKNAR